MRDVAPYILDDDLQYRRPLKVVLYIDDNFGFGLRSDQAQCEVRKQHQRSTYRTAAASVSENGNIRRKQRDTVTSVFSSALPSHFSHAHFPDERGEVLPAGLHLRPF
jgi:hypothetical protein